MRVPCGCHAAACSSSASRLNTTAPEAAQRISTAIGAEFLSVRTKQKEGFLEANNIFVGFDGFFMGCGGDLVEFNGGFSCFFTEFRGDLVIQDCHEIGRNIVVLGNI